VLITREEALRVAEPKGALMPAEPDTTTPPSVPAAPPAAKPPVPVDGAPDAAPMAQPAPVPVPIIGAGEPNYCGSVSTALESDGPDPSVEAPIYDPFTDPELDGVPATDNEPQKQDDATNDQSKSEQPAGVDPFDDDWSIDGMPVVPATQLAPEPAASCSSEDTLALAPNDHPAGDADQLAPLVSPPANVDAETSVKPSVEPRAATESPPSEAPADGPLVASASVVTPVTFDDARVGSPSNDGTAYDDGFDPFADDRPRPRPTASTEDHVGAVGHDSPEGTVVAPPRDLPGESDAAWGCRR
jgi:hypothetical protein